MTDEERYDAALQAAIGFFQAAGYTWDEASGTFTAAPEGAKLSYEMIVPGSGTGTHPDFMLAEYARDALAEIGITLVINDPSDTNVLWNALDAGTQEIWCQSWASGNDPDMYQIWHSNNAPGKPGSTGSNHASLEDPELDALILEGRTSSGYLLPQGHLHPVPRYHPRLGGRGAGLPAQRVLPLLDRTGQRRHHYPGYHLLLGLDERSGKAGNERVNCDILQT